MICEAKLIVAKLVISVIRERHELRTGVSLMSYINDEEALGRLLRQAYRPASIPPDVKDQIRGRLLTEVERQLESNSKPWARPSLMIPILASIAGGLIAYGYWISKAFV